MFVRLNKTPAKPASTMMSAGDRDVNKDKIKTTAQIPMQILSARDFWASFVTAFKIKTQTQARMPLNACLTIGRSAKFLRHAAIIVMIIMEGVTIPNVAKIAPGIPAVLYPTKVAVFTAIIPATL